MLAEELNSPYSTIYTILTENLGKRKVCARFVPHQLNAPPHKTKKVNEFLIKNRFVSLTTLRIRLIYHRVTIFVPKLKTAMKGDFYDDVPTI